MALWRYRIIVMVISICWARTSTMLSHYIYRTKEQWTDFLCVYEWYFYNNRKQVIFIFKVLPVDSRVSWIFLWVFSIKHLVKCSIQFSSVSSVTQSFPTLCDSMNRSTPSLPVYHQFPEFTQTHVHRVSDAI